MTGFAIAVFQSPGSFSNRLLLLVLACMVFARSAAMAFNRYVDRNIDADNPRTAVREIPAGVVSSKNALVFTIINAGAFVICTYFINRLCFLLSPIALLVILGYSYTKKFTALCHLILGLGLALAPIGAYLAVLPVFNVLPVILGLVVLLWVSGFDIIYALQDEEFDKSNNLNSIPVSLGPQKAMHLSSLLHLFAFALLLYFGILSKSMYEQMHLMQWLGIFLFGILLIYQHRIVSGGDLSRLNLAFFTTNGIASLIFAAFYIGDFFL